MSGAFDYGALSTGGGKLRYQEFTSSGTFTPSQKLLKNGGQVFLDLRGGGGGGGRNVGTSAYGGGGNSKHVTSYTVTGVTSVVIGAGGAGSTSGSGSAGGDSTFGTLTVAGGGAGEIAQAGYGSGNEGSPGITGFYAATVAFSASVEVKPANFSLTASTGCGGGWGQNGQAGYCRVWWFE